MIYIIEGEEELFINRKIKEICNSSDSNIIKIDGNDKNFSIDYMLDSCLGNSLFSEKTIVLVKDAPFLIKKFEDKELEKIYAYANSPIYETELVFYTLNNSHNGRLKAYKTISKNAQVITCDSLDYANFNTYVNQQINFNKLNINKDAIYLLNSMCKRSATLLDRNIKILINYPDVITNEVVSKLCTSSDDNNSFDLINAITNKDVSKAILYSRKMFNENDSIMSVVGLLASQLRFLYHLSYLISEGKSKREIIEITKCSDGRYAKSLETLNNLSSYRIIELLNELSKLDIKCKTDNSIPDSSKLELFIIELLNKNNYASN